MREALKILLLFKKPTWDDYRLPYIFLGIIGWLEILAIVIGMIDKIKQQSGGEIIRRLKHDKVNVV